MEAGMNMDLANNCYVRMYHSIAKGVVQSTVLNWLYRKDMVYMNTNYILTRGTTYREAAKWINTGQ